MKKFLLFGAASVLLAFSACQKDGYTEVSRTLSSSAINIITDENDGSVVVSYGYYTFNLTMTNTEQHGTVTSPDLIANNSALGFTSDDQTYKSTGYDVYFENIKATAGSTGMQIQNSQILGLPYNYEENNNTLLYGFYIDTTDIGEYTYSLGSQYNMETVAKYNIGSSYRVNTFQINTFFKGNTETLYTSGGEDHRFSTDGITYRFIIDKEENADVYTATMIMYNAKFSDSEREPLKVAIIVKGLDVDFSANGIKISGQDIIPDVYEAGATTPYENFKFNNIEFNTTNEYYTSGMLDFSVGGIYTGHFEGSYINPEILKFYNMN